jgi:hypothetical protein
MAARSAFRSKPKPVPEDSFLGNFAEKPMNPWKTGLALLAAGAVLGVTAIVLEG